MAVVLSLPEMKMESQSIRWDRMVCLCWIVGYIFIVALFALTTLFVMLIYNMKDHLSTFWLVVMIICGVLFFFSYLNIGLSVPGFASKAEEPS